MGRGRPSKFTSEVQRQLELMARRGWTDIQMCELIGIDESTLARWKQSKPDFFKSLKDWKDEADHSVERALYERACGYDCPDTKAQWVSDEKGGHWEYANLRKFYPPDPTSMIFWLKNRQPERWRDKQELEHSGDIKVDVTVKFVTANVENKG